MPNDTAAQHASKVARNATERIARLERVLERFVGSTSQAVTEIQQQLAQYQELLDAVIQVVGVESITETVLESRRQKLIDGANELREGIAKKVEAGTLKATDTITETSFLLCGVTDGNGNKIEEARVGVNVPQLLKQFKDAAIGQKAGHKLATPDGRTLEVLEVYDVSVPSVQQVAQEAAATAPAAPGPYIENKQEFPPAKIIQGPAPVLPPEEAPKSENGAQ